MQGITARLGAGGPVVREPALAGIDLAVSLDASDLRQRNVIACWVVEIAGWLTWFAPGMSEQTWPLGPGRMG